MLQSFSDGVIVEGVVGGMYVKRQYCSIRFELEVSKQITKTKMIEYFYDHASALRNKSLLIFSFTCFFAVDGVLCLVYG